LKGDTVKKAKRKDIPFIWDEDLDSCTIVDVPSIEEFDKFLIGVRRIYGCLQMELAVRRLLYPIYRRYLATECNPNYYPVIIKKDVSKDCFDNNVIVTVLDEYKKRELNKQKENRKNNARRYNKKTKFNNKRY
jgi:hypothetical protein